MNYGHGQRLIHTKTGRRGWIYWTGGSIGAMVQFDGPEPVDRQWFSQDVLDKDFVILLSDLSGVVTCEAWRQT